MKVAIIQSGGGPPPAGGAHRGGGMPPFGVGFICCTQSSVGAWSVRFETDHALRWDPERGCGANRGGHAYDGERFFEHSRGGAA